MGDRFLASFILNLLLLAEVTLPILLITFLGFFAWRIIRKRWIGRIFLHLVYRRHPFVKGFYEEVGCLVEEKSNKTGKPLAYGALILCLGLMGRILWPYLFSDGKRVESFLEEGLPLTFLYMGLVFLGLGVTASVVSSFLFIKETRRFDVYNRSIEIYLLSKYFENILHIVLGILLVIGVAYLWFFLLGQSVPLFAYVEMKVGSFGVTRANFGEMLRIWRHLIMAFKDQFQTWCVISFLISVASLTIPYLWFKGRRFTKIFLALFFSATSFSYLVSSLIRRFVVSEPAWIFIAVWIFSALITSMVFHLINTIWLNRVSLCRHCEAENSAYSKYCSQCGHKLIVLPRGTAQKR